MAVSYQDVVDQKKALDDVYQDTHEKFRKLRDVYQGKYWQIAERESQERSITSIFRDLGRGNRTQLPPIRIIRNIVQEICVKYQSFLGPVPMVNFYTDAPEDDERRQQMVRKERYTYGIWRAGRMSKILNQVAWYHPLMGDAFIGVFPDTDLNIPVPILRSPETAYPLPGFGGGESAGHIFFWKERMSAAKRAFPAQADQMRASNVTGRANGTDPMVDVYEYSDGIEFARFVGGVKTNGVEHDFGFDLFAHSKFIDVPGDVFGHSAVEQAVNLNEADNMLYSLLFQAMIENIFPTIVLVDPMKAPEEIMKGPGAVIGVNPGGDVKMLAPPVQSVPVILEYLAQNKQSIQEVTGMPAVNFGTSPASSIVTGAAINELQGAGTGSTVQMVQAGLGLVMSQWCEKAIQIQRRMWPDTEVTLNYVTPLTKKGGQDSRGAMTIKGKDLEGGTANEIVWSPAMDVHDKLVMWLQAKGAGLVSDQYILKQVGIPDPEAMTQEIFQEEMDRAVLGFMVQQFTQNPDAANAAVVEDEANAFIEGNPFTRRAPAAAAPGGQLSAAPGPPGGGPGAPVTPGGPVSSSDLTALQPGGGALKSPPLPLPPGSPAPQGSAAAGGAAPQASSSQVATVNAVVRALAGGDYRGKVWLVGEIAVNGQTSGPVDVAVTDPADRQTVAGQAPQYEFRFHVVESAPAEQSVPVTG